MDLVYPAEYRDYRDHQFFLLSILVGMGTWEFRLESGMYAGEKKELAERRRRILRNHFKEVLQGLQTAVRAGYSMEQGVTECRREMERLLGMG